MCVRDGVHLLLVELFQDVLGVAVVVRFVGGCGRILLCGLKKQVSNDCELFVSVTCFRGDGREQGVFVELDGKVFGTFWGLRFGGFDLVFAVEVAPDPVEAGGSGLVDNETGWVTTDGLHRLFDWCETVLGSGFGLRGGGGFGGQNSSKSGT